LATPRAATIHGKQHATSRPTIHGNFPLAFTPDRQTDFRASACHELQSPDSVTADMVRILQTHDAAGFCCNDSDDWSWNIRQSIVQRRGTLQTIRIARLWKPQRPPCLVAGGKIGPGGREVKAKPRLQSPRGSSHTSVATESGGRQSAGIRMLRDLPHVDRGRQGFFPGKGTRTALAPPAVSGNRFFAKNPLFSKLS
jgi:hypothetical protein